MIRTNVRSNIDEVAKQLTAVQRKSIPTAASRALNKTAKQAVTEASRAIGKQYAIKKRVIKRSIKLTQRASTRRLMSIIEAKGNPISLAEFGARQTKKGVTVKVKGGGRKLIRSAWIRRFGGGKVVFARGEYRGGKFVPGKARLPISKLVTFGIPQVYATEETERAIGKKIREAFPRVFNHELEYELRKRFG